jgi:hypothetical protein
MFNLVDKRLVVNKKLLIARIEANSRKEAEERAWSRYALWMERGARVIKERPKKKPGGRHSTGRL